MYLAVPMRAKNLADNEDLALSRRQHELMIDLLRGRYSWALAICVDHMQFSKSDYLGRTAGGMRGRIDESCIHPNPAQPPRHPEVLALFGRASKGERFALAAHPSRRARARTSG
jgi:hypothetical protein